MLDRAADLIEKVGLHQGDWYPVNDADGAMRDGYEPGLPCCTIAATQIVQQPADVIPDIVLDRFLTHHRAGDLLHRILDTLTRQPTQTARTPHVGGPALGAPLSTREFETLVRISQGATNAAIGRALDLSEDTVKTHARRLFQKLGARDRAHAVAIGYQLRYQLRYLSLVEPASGLRSVS